MLLAVPADYDHRREDLDAERIGGYHIRIERDPPHLHAPRIVRRDRFGFSGVNAVDKCLGMRRLVRLDQWDGHFARLAPRRPKIEEDDLSTGPRQVEATAALERQRQRRGPDRNHRRREKAWRNQKFPGGQHDQHDRSDVRDPREAAVHAAGFEEDREFPAQSTHTNPGMTTTKPATVTLDARTIPTAQRSSYILEAFDRLPIGGVLELSEESDPRALRNEFAQYRPGKFAWDARNLGSGRWTVRLERIDERADVETFLSHCPPFGAAKAETIRQLAAVATERRYKHGETVFDEGEKWPYLGFVREGKIVLTLLSADGKTQALGERLVFDPLNETGVFDGGGATTRTEALTDATLVLVPSEAVQSAVRNR